MTTTPQPQVDIEELEALAKNASRSSWRLQAREPYRVETSGGCGYVVVEAPESNPQSEDDCAFIAAANPSTVLALIAEVRALRAVKLRVHEIALNPTASTFQLTRDIAEIERITR